MSTDRRVVWWCTVHEAVAPLYEFRGYPFQSTLCKSFEATEGPCELVEGEKVWWCETHWALGDDAYCSEVAEGHVRPGDCRMVERLLIPIG